MNFQLAPISAPELLNTIGADFTTMLRGLETQGHSIDEVAEMLESNTAHQFNGDYPDGSPVPGLWARLKGEFRCLICTDDLRYAQLRLRLGKDSGIASALMLSLISSSISAHLGLEAGLCTPFIALLLISIGRTTQVAWCGDIPAPPLLQEHIPTLIDIDCRRLQALELKAAYLGINTPVEITIEIEDLKTKIDQLRLACTSKR